MGVTLVADGGATSLRMGLLAEPGQPVLVGQSARDEQSFAEPAQRPSDPGQPGAAHPSIARLVEVPGFQWTRNVDPVEQQCDRLVGGWNELGRPGPVDVLAFGLAGGAADWHSRERLAALVAERVGASRVYATGDDVTTHLGVLDGDPGVVVAAGTGTLCVAVTAEGQLCNVDGLGYLFGDLGSGFALGLAGIRAALAAVEVRGPSTALVSRLAAWVGEPVREEVKGLYRSATLIADVAGFAAEVAAVAEDDEVARSLCRDAGEQVATDVVSAIRQAFPDAASASVAVSWSGGILRSCPAVFDTFIADVTERCPEVVAHVPRGDSLSGAVRLASGAQVPHLAAVVVAGGGRRGPGG